MNYLMGVILSITLASGSVGYLVGMQVGYEGGEDEKELIRQLQWERDMAEARFDELCKAIPVDVLDALDLQECGDL